MIRPLSLATDGVFPPVLLPLASGALDFFAAPAIRRYLQANLTKHRVVDILRSMVARIRPCSVPTDLFPVITALAFKNLYP